MPVIFETDEPPDDGEPPEMTISLLIQVTLPPPTNWYPPYQVTQQSANLESSVVISPYI